MSKITTRDGFQINIGDEVYFCFRKGKTTSGKMDAPSKINYINLEGDYVFFKDEGACKTYIDMVNNQKIITHDGSVLKFFDTVWLVLNNGSTLILKEMIISPENWYEPSVVYSSLNKSKCQTYIDKVNSSEAKSLEEVKEKFGESQIPCEFRINVPKINLEEATFIVRKERLDGINGSAYSYGAGIFVDRSELNSSTCEKKGFTLKDLPTDDLIKDKNVIDLEKTFEKQRIRREQESLKYKQGKIPEELKADLEKNAPYRVKEIEDSIAKWKKCVSDYENEVSKDIKNEISEQDATKIKCVIAGKEQKPDLHNILLDFSKHYDIPLNSVLEFIICQKSH